MLYFLEIIDHCESSFLKCEYIEKNGKYLKYQSKYYIITSCIIRISPD